ncbi:MAG: HK97 family phage prohead protease [Treponema sp.]|jgi:HK97 family phage prohead protease|nr:HK97 family phage prohead protease [Treponema sp.]
MKDLQRRYIALDQCGIRADGEEGEGRTYTITGTPILYNRMTVLYENADYVIQEIIDPGAAREALGVAEQVLLWNHDSAKPMAARKNNTLTVREDDNGVHIDADVSGSVWGRDGHEAIRSNLVNAMSFAFFCNRDGYTVERTERDKKEVITRKIHKFSRIVDFAPVTYPAYKDTEISARGADDILTEIEKGKREETHKKIEALLTEFREEE